MKRIIKSIAVTLVLFFGAMSIVTLPISNAKIEAASVYLSRSSQSVTKGEGFTLRLYNYSKGITWYSGNKKIATVTSSGYVKGINKGTTFIYAKIAGKTYSCKVTVETPYISKTSITLYTGSTYRLAMNGNTQKATWASSTTRIAKVSSTGLVTAVSAGKTNIKATVGKKTYYCTVTVKNSPLAVSPSYISVDKGKTYTLKAITSPSATVYWKSSNTKIATVNSKGVVTGKAAGTVTISAKANGVTKNVGVTVHAGSFTLDTSSATIGVGGKITVNGKISPWGPVTWKVSDSKIVSVDGIGAYATITAKAKGTATITATGNGMTRTIKITVINPYFNAPSTVTVNYGSTAKINISASPKPSYIAWSNDDYNKVAASIGSDGTVKGNYVGTSKLSATVNGIKRTITVTVKNPKVNVYEAGYYVVGKDIPVGEYMLTDYGNKFAPAIATYRDQTFSRTANTVGFRKNMFVTLKQGQIIKLTGCKATPAPAKYSGTGTGAYRVGKDIVAGTYKITRTTSDVEGLCNLFATSDLSTNNVVFSTKRISTAGTTITVTNGQLLSLIDAKATKIN